MTIVIKNQTWWKKSTNLERNLTIIAGGTVLASSFLALVLSTLYLNHSCNTESLPLISVEKNGLIGNSRNLLQNEEYEKDNITCLTAGCVKAANYIIKNMDLSVNPCDDFYQFACANYLKNTVINDDSGYEMLFNAINKKTLNELRMFISEPIQSDEQKPLKMAKLLFKSCMDVEKIEKKGLEPIKVMFKSLGGWPVLDAEKWNDTEFTWKESVYKLNAAGYKNDYFIKLYIDTNPKNTTIRAITLNEASLTLNRKYLTSGTDNKFITAYYRYMVDIAVLFGADRQKATKELKESLDFEIRLVKITLTSEERRDKDKLYNPMKIADLQQKFPSIPWQEYLNKLLNPLTIRQDDIIIVKSPKYLSDLETLLNNTSKRILANYVFSRMTMESVQSLTEELRLKNKEFLAELTGITVSEPRWKECLTNIKSYFDLAIDSVYVRRIFDNNVKKNALEMVNNIREEMLKLLSSNDWMDDQTKKNAINKAKLMTYHIAYPDELLDNKKLNALYENLEVNDKDYYISILNLTKFDRDYLTMKLRQPINKSEDWMTNSVPTTINAFYKPTANSILLPAALLQNEVFSNDRPQYMNYGAIGSIIGHENIHGFDNIGRLYDGKGNLIDWWAEETKKQFLEKSMCIIRQYGNYTDPEVGLKLNGDNTQGENIADNGGIRLAYYAYNTWTNQHGVEPRLPGLQNYTPQQMFWLSTASLWCSKYRPKVLESLIITGTHLPPHSRIIGTLANQKEFSNDFQCPLGSNMNPAYKCQVW